MPLTPIEVLQLAYQTATNTATEAILAELPEIWVQDLKVIVDQAETQKAVLGVVLTSVTYKVYRPSQDIRIHQDQMQEGYSGRTFDTKYVTPFLQEHFPHFAMRESAWLTRSLEQPHPYNLDYPGHIRNRSLKAAFLNTLDHVQSEASFASKILDALMALMLQTSANYSSFHTHSQVAEGLSITKIVDAVNQHIQYAYENGTFGTARIPVLVIYAVYQLLMPEVMRYAGKTLAPLESHTSPDARSHAFGDIDIINADGTCFESIEVKHRKPITPGMIDIAYEKIRIAPLDRYYILTTNEPNFNNYPAVVKEIEKYREIHSCQIIVNGVIPSLKYYLRLTSHPENFVEVYTWLLQAEFARASGIKSQHLQVWQEIRKTSLHCA